MNNVAFKIGGGQSLKFWPQPRIFPFNKCLQWGFQATSSPSNISREAALYDAYCRILNPSLNQLPSFRNLNIEDKIYHLLRCLDVRLANNIGYMASKEEIKQFIVENHRVDLTLQAILDHKVRRYFPSHPTPPNNPKKRAGRKGYFYPTILKFHERKKEEIATFLYIMEKIMASFRRNNLKDALVYDLAAGTSDIGLAIAYGLSHQKIKQVIAVDRDPKQEGRAEDLIASLNQKENITTNKIPWAYITDDLSNYQYGNGSATPTIFLSKHACAIATDYIIEEVIQKKPEVYIGMTCCYQKMVTEQKDPSGALALATFVSLNKLHDRFSFLNGSDIYEAIHDIALATHEEERPPISSHTTPVRLSMILIDVIRAKKLKDAGYKVGLVKVPEEISKANHFLIAIQPGLSPELEEIIDKYSIIIL